MDEGGLKWAVSADGGRVNMKALVDDEGVIRYHMCCICFEYIKIEDLYRDKLNQQWDMCQQCGELEDRMKDD